MIYSVDTKLSQLREYPFFESLGSALPSSVIPVKDWDGVIRASDVPKWDNCRLMARNRLQSLLEDHSCPEADKWNEIIGHIKPTVLSIAANIVERFVPLEFAGHVKGDIAWDLMFICMEYFYQDFANPPFCLPFLDPWYASGHFPCGWDGKVFGSHWDGDTTGGRLFVF